MNLITVTSDNFLDSTLVLLASLRAWHPDEPVHVYALQTNWNTSHTEQLKPYNVTLHMVPEADTSHRQGGAGRPFHAVWKLEVFLEQSEPFVYFDADLVILKPLDAIFEVTRRDGWFTVLEGTDVYDYNKGGIAEVTNLPPQKQPVRSFNSGVLGCDPAQHREIFQTAKNWADTVKISGVYFGDQGLMNLAWYSLRQQIPPGGDPQFNGGPDINGRFDLTHAILHVAGHGFVKLNTTKAAYQREVWSRWPRGAKLTGVHQTDVWQQSLPHPWQWINQCTQRQHRKAVRAIRESSLQLRGIEWLVVRDEYEAFLLHPTILAEQAKFWRSKADTFSGMRYIPTYHLDEDGRFAPQAGRRLRRLLNNLRSKVR